MSEIDIDKDKNESPETGYTNSVYLKAGPAVESKSPPPWVWVSIAGLFLVALSVIFVLPTVVTQYELPLERRVDISSIHSPQNNSQPTPAISPFEEAQRSLRRRGAQEVLAELLVKQETLQDLNVEIWAQSEYESALAKASIGDGYYRNQDFLLATESYSNGLDELEDTLLLVPAALQRTLMEAQEALAQSNSSIAEEKFALALLLDPDNDLAQVGLERSLALDGVLALFDEANIFLEDDQYEAALKTYEKIVDIDSYNEIAKQKITEVSINIKEREFSNIMSSGYNFLENDELYEAIVEFRRASELGIRRDQALAAILQAEGEIANSEIEIIQARISSATEVEDWHNVVAEYDNVLAIDSNLLFAIDGRDYASKRAQLDDLLQSAIAEPERFYEDDVYEQTVDIYFIGREVDKEQSGVRLKDQLAQLEVLLKNSQVPLDIKFVSDNLTDVTLLRIGGIGSFEQTTVSLKPGRYIALGKRIGYREVREEFVVGFGQTPEIVIVQCKERIAPTNR
ncbi:MAG: hypothetical protein P8N40_03570 [Gammaproteobacteria bacterium]|nr:hypothetical protein [Gammaproteobacteria bacterium]